MNMGYLRVWASAFLALGAATPVAAASIVHGSDPNIVLGLPNGPTQVVLDVNGDGVDDFRIDRLSITVGSIRVFDHNFVIADGEGDAYWLAPSPFGMMLDWAYDRGDGSLIGWFHEGHWWLPTFGPTWPSEPAYLGVAFMADNQYHFGWMSMSIGWFEGVAGVVRIHEYAYESSPGVGIPAGAVPSPGALGLLALGAAWKNRRSRSAPGTRR
jgi:hypothetical protein